MTSNEPIAPEKFGGVNFKRWQENMKIFLTMLGLYFVIENDPPSNDLHEPARTIELQIYAEKDDLCRCRILNHLSDTLFDVYLHIKSAKDIWNVIDKKYKLPPSWKNFGLSLKHKIEDMTMETLISAIRIQEQHLENDLVPPL
ncbi:hypothetical protein I3760_01G080500, partial [Carya illinoinensis]